MLHKNQLEGTGKSVTLDVLSDTTDDLAWFTVRISSHAIPNPAVQITAGEHCYLVWTTNGLISIDKIVFLVAKRLVFFVFIRVRGE
jgi:hypothetical protein